MKGILLVCVLLFSFTTHAKFQKILDLTSQTSDVTSVVDASLSLGIVYDPLNAYSVQCNMTGATFDVTVEVQSSLDSISWVTVASTAVTLAQPILFDISGSRPRFARVRVLHNSGTYNVLCILDA